MSLFGQIRRIDYLARHFYNFYPYVTPRKIFNLALNYVELKRIVAEPRSLPPYIKIEPTPLCQLKCPGCWHARPEYKARLNPGMRMSLDELKRVIGPLANCLLGVSLSNHGEPVLHREIASLIRYMHEQNIAVSFPTNLSVKLDDEAIDALAASGADSLFVSLDGTSEETYLKYRVGGKFELVKSNVLRLHQAKKRMGLKRPRLVWKFVIFEHNKHETEIVKSTYKALGFDAYEMVPDARSAAYQAKKKASFAALRASARKRACFWPWHTMMVDWDGEVAPCCTNTKFGLGNAIEQNAAEIWRSVAYSTLRGGFREPEQMHPLCRGCLGLSADPSSDRASLVSDRDKPTTKTSGPT